MTPLQADLFRKEIAFVEKQRANERYEARRKHILATKERAKLWFAEMRRKVNQAK
jgi:hypothetical protein